MSDLDRWLALAMRGERGALREVGRIAARTGAHDEAVRALDACGADAVLEGSPRCRATCRASSVELARVRRIGEDTFELVAFCPACEAWAALETDNPSVARLVHTLRDKQSAPVWPGGRHMSLSLAPVYAELTRLVLELPVHRPSPEAARDVLELIREGCQGWSGLSGRAALERYLDAWRAIHPTGWMDAIANAVEGRPWWVVSMDRRSVLYGFKEKRVCDGRWPWKVNAYDHHGRDMVCITFTKTVSLEGSLPELPGVPPGGAAL